MTDEQSQLEESISRLKQQREELAVQINFGKVVAQEEWERLNVRLDELAKEYEPLKDAVEQSAGNVFDSLKLVADEVKEGFDRIRKTL
jgi:chromosome segregation ATPase